MKLKMQSNLQDKNLYLQMLRADGFFTFHNDAIQGKNIERYKEMCTDLSYERGGSFKTDRVSDFSLEDRSIFASEFIVSLFSEFKAKLQDVFVTHEYKTGLKARNNFLHFDRLRSLKVLVYLTDVNLQNGPFSLVKGSHITGMKFRREFASLDNYAEKKNRIDLDYPEIKYDLKPITGPAGTTVVFDSDVFHMGGDVKEGCERLIVRSHWYKDYNWRVDS